MKREESLQCSFWISSACCVLGMLCITCALMMSSCGPENLMEKEPYEYCGRDTTYVEEQDECIGEANMFTVCRLLDEKLFELTGDDSIDDMIILTCKMLAVWEASGGLEKAE